MDLNKLTNGDKIIGLSGVLLFVFSFFKWLGVKIELRGLGSVSDSSSAWSFTLPLIAVLLGIALVAYVAMKASGVKLPDLGGITWNQIVLGAAAIAFLFILIKIITGASVDVDGVDKTRKIGIFLGLIASGGMVAGAFLNAKESGDLPGALGGTKGGIRSAPAGGLTGNEPAARPGRRVSKSRRPPPPGGGRPRSGGTA